MHNVNICMYLTRHFGTFRSWKNKRLWKQKKPSCLLNLVQIKTAQSTCLSQNLPSLGSESPSWWYLVQNPTRSLLENQKQKVETVSNLNTNLKANKMPKWELFIWSTPNQDFAKAIGSWVLWKSRCFGPAILGSCSCTGASHQVMTLAIPVAYTS